MLSAIISERWRGRIVYTLMSVFVAWHALCLIVGPAPQSSLIADKLRPLVGTYLALFSLDVKWGFFAPIGGASEFRYEVIDSAGKTHTFRPTSGYAWYHPSKLSVDDRFRAVIETPDIYGDHLIASYCRKHSALAPVEIRLLEVAQNTDLLAYDHVNGKHPLDPELSTTETLWTRTCPTP